MRFPIDVILVCIRWYAAYPLSYRHIEEMMEERGVSVDHSTINRYRRFPSDGTPRHGRHPAVLRQSHA